MYYVGSIPAVESDIKHFGLRGMRWGVRRWQYDDGRFNEAGKKRYFDQDQDTTKRKTSRVAETVKEKKRQVGEAISNGKSKVENAVSKAKGYADKGRQVAKKYAIPIALTAAVAGYAAYRLINTKKLFDAAEANQGIPWRELGRARGHNYTLDALKAHDRAIVRKLTGDRSIR